MQATAKNFLAKNPTELLRIGDVVFYEHPTRGDEAPVYAIWKGYLINTGVYDLDDFYPDVMEEFKSEWAERFNI